MHFGVQNAFFNIKEIEKIGINAGIVPQSIKEVLQNLLSDNIVKTDKLRLINIKNAFRVNAVISLCSAG